MVSAIASCRSKLQLLHTKLWGWGIYTDLRSTVVSSTFGGLSGAIIGLAAAAWAAGPAEERIIFTNDQGFAQPMRSLVEPLQKEEDPLSVRFAPPEVEQLFVCEYAHMVGSSAREILLSYLDKYSECLSVSRMSETEYIVRPNRASGSMVSKDNEWFCKCGY